MRVTTQTIKEIPVPVEFYINKLQNGDIEPIPVVNYHVPFMVEQWLQTQAVYDFLITWKERNDMAERIDRIVTFEVLLDINNDGVAYSANCQTICPAFVAAWIELEAKKQYNQSKEKSSCTSSLSRCTQ